MLLKKILILSAKTYVKCFYYIFLIYYKIFFKKNYKVKSLHFKNSDKERHSFIFLLENKKTHTEYVYKKRNVFILIHDKIYLKVDFINDKKLNKYFIELKNNGFNFFPDYFLFKNRLISEYLNNKEYIRLDEYINRSADNKKDIFLYKEKIKNIIIFLNHLGYIHGDIKAKNIYINNYNNSIKFIDWDGLRKIREFEKELDIEKFNNIFNFL